MSKIPPKKKVVPKKGDQNKVRKIRKGKSRNKSRVRRGSKNSKGVRRSRSKSKMIKSEVKSVKEKLIKSNIMKSKVAQPPPPPPTAIVAKNQTLLNKIILLMEGLKAEAVTRSTKDDLDKIQALMKNIQFRDNGNYDRIREIQFTDVQKLVIKAVSGLEIDSQDTNLYITITTNSGKGLPQMTTAKTNQGNKVNTVSNIPTPNIEFPYERLEFVVTKANK